MKGERREYEYVVQDVKARQFQKDFTACSAAISQIGEIAMPGDEMTKGFVKKRSFDDQSFARKCAWLVLATLAFLVFFYSGTALMSIVYPLDEAMLAF